MITHFDPAPNNCTIYGDPTLFALPIRLSFYLPAFSNIIAIASGVHAPFQSNKRALLAISLALFIRYIQNVLAGSLAFVEFTLFYLIVVFIPSGITVSGTVLRDRWIAILQLSFLAIVLPAAVWVPWTRVQQGRMGKEHCLVKMYLYTYFDLYGERWRVFLKTMASLFQLLEIPYVIVAVMMIVIWVGDTTRSGGRVLRQWWPTGRRTPRAGDRDYTGRDDAKREKEKRRSEKMKERDAEVRPPRKVLAFWLAVYLVNIMLFVEMFIRGNNMVLDDWSWTETSQLIPFLVGASTLVSTVFGITTYKLWKRKGRNKKETARVDIENGEPTAIEDADMRRPEGALRRPEGRQRYSSDRRPSDAGTRSSATGRGRVASRPPDYPSAWTR